MGCFLIVPALRTKHNDVICGNNPHGIHVVGCFLIVPALRTKHNDVICGNNPHGIPAVVVFQQCQHRGFCVLTSSDQRQ